MVQVNAYDYNEKYKEKLELGDCPPREITYQNGTTRIVVCPFKHTGDTYLIPIALSDLKVKRVQTNEDIHSKIGAGVGIGVGVMGLAGVNVKVKASVDVQTNKKQLTLTSNYKLQTGVLTLRNAKAVGVPPPESLTKLYLSEIVLGGEETLLVTMEFESEKKKTEVEITVTVKILFIKISAKMRYVQENFKSAAAVKVSRLSSWRSAEIQTFAGPGSLIDAINTIEKYEKAFETAPAELQALPVTDRSVHSEYHFNSWETAPELNVNEALDDARLEVLFRQITELEAVVKKIEAYRNYANRGGQVTTKQYDDLEEYGKELKEKIEKIKIAHNSYIMMNEEERKEASNIYGRSRAPFYYDRKLNNIFVPGDDFTYLQDIMFF